MTFRVDLRRRTGTDATRGSSARCRAGCGRRRGEERGRHPVGFAGAWTDVVVRVAGGRSTSSTSWMREKLHYHHFWRLRTHLLFGAATKLKPLCSSVGLRGIVRTYRMDRSHFEKRRWPCNKPRVHHALFPPFYFIYLF